MKIKKVYLDKNKAQVCGIKDAIIWGFVDEITCHPIAYIKKPKGISRKEFEDILDRLEINLKRDKKFIYDEDYIKTLRAKAKQSWPSDLDADEWVREIRGGYDL